MNKQDRLRLQLHHRQLVHDVMVENLLPQLIQAGVLTVDDSERISAQPTKQDRNSILLSLLPDRGKKAYEAFKECLQAEYSWLVTLLDNTHLEETASPPQLQPVTSVCLDHSVLRRVSSHGDVVRQWKTLGRALALTDGELHSIEYQCHLDGPTEMAYQVLESWRQGQGRQATVPALISSLRHAGFTFLADELEGN